MFSRWILFLDPDGTAKSNRRLAGPAGSSYAGSWVAGPGDIDGDGTPDLAVSTGSEVWILFLRPDGSVRTGRDLSPGSNGFPVVPSFEGSGNAFFLRFGTALDGLGDFDGNGVPDLLVGAREWLFEGGIGHVWLVLLESDGSVGSTVQINSSTLGFWPIPNPCVLWYDDGDFGVGAAAVGDLDGNGVTDLAIGASRGYFFCCGEGSAWLVMLNADGSVASSEEIDGGPPYGMPISPLDLFGYDVAGPGDIDGDGRPDLAIGAPAAFGTPDPGCEYNEDPLGLAWLIFGPK